MRVYSMNLIWKICYHKLPQGHMKKITYDEVRKCSHLHKDLITLDLFYVQQTKKCNISPEHQLWEKGEKKNQGC